MIHATIFYEKTQQGQMMLVTELPSLRCYIKIHRSYFSIMEDIANFICKETLYVLQYISMLHLILCAH